MNTTNNNELHEMVITTSAGQLANLINSHNAGKIKALKAKGELNGSDVRIIRKMVNLQELDLSETNIVSGGGPYLEEYTTEDNIIGEKLFCDMPHLEKVILPASITEIRSYAFGGCISLKVVVFEDGDEWLEFASTDDVFKHCPIESVYLGREIDYLCNDIDDEYYFETYYSPFRNNQSLKSIEVGKNVTTIAAWAFAECKGLKSVHIHGVTEYGYNSFFFCNDDVHLILSNGASLIDSFDNVYGGRYFSKVVFTNEVTDIDIENIEYYCKTISKIQLKGNIPPSVNGKLTNAIDKQKCVLIVPKDSADAYRQANYWKEFDNIIEVNE